MQGGVVDFLDSVITQPSFPPSPEKGEEKPQGVGSAGKQDALALGLAFPAQHVAIV